jgi:hypothetical protein
MYKQVNPDIIGFIRYSVNDIRNGKDRNEDFKPPGKIPVNEPVCQTKRQFYCFVYLQLEAG